METSDIFIQYGALGAVAFIAIVAARMAFDRLQKASDSETARANRLEEQLRLLNEEVRTDVVEALTRASLAMADSNRAVGDALAAVRRGS